MYGNGVSDTALQRLQNGINFAARVVSGRKKFEHVSDVVNELGRLSSRAQYSHVETQRSQNK